MKLYMILKWFCCNRNAPLGFNRPLWHNYELRLLVFLHTRLAKYKDPLQSGWESHWCIPSCTFLKFGKWQWSTEQFTAVGVTWSRQADARYRQSSTTDCRIPERNPHEYFFCTWKVSAKKWLLTAETFFTEWTHIVCDLIHPSQRVQLLRVMLRITGK